MAADTETRVKKVISEVLNVPVAQIKTDHKFTADLGAESFQSIELIAGFEEEFNISMNEDEALSVQTVGDAVRFIEKCLK
jgi:acyl carrier protein